MYQTTSNSQITLQDPAIVYHPTRNAKTRHLAALDGLRGFAAISVFLFHLAHWLSVAHLATNSGLAVDLFFCMSGFVLPLAYKKRLQTTTLLDFYTSRLIRLMPLISLALLLGAGYALFRHKGANPVSTSALNTALLLGLLNLPYFGAPSNIGGPQLFPLNGPQFTLFFELFINLFWWATRRFTSPLYYWTIAAICTLLVIRGGIGGDMPSNFLIGFPRVAALFFTGVIIFVSLPKIPKHWDWTKIFYVLCIAMGMVFYYPFELGLNARLFWTFAFSPLLVLAGSQASLGRHMETVCLFLGELSYPIYALHYPLFCWANGSYQAVVGRKNGLVEAPVIAILVMSASFLALRFYDEPLRKWLTSRLQVKSQKSLPKNEGVAEAGYTTAT